MANARRASPERTARAACATHPAASLAADAVPGEPESLAGCAPPDVLVLRSLTKTWSLAGLRVGYAIGAPDVLNRLSSPRPHWPLGTLQLEAITACCAPEAVAAARADAEQLALWRSDFCAALRGLGLDVVDGQAPFVLFAAGDAVLTRKRLRLTNMSVKAAAWSSLLAIVWWLRAGIVGWPSLNATSSLLRLVRVWVTLVKKPGHF